MGYLFLPKGFQQSNEDLETRSLDNGICTLPREPLMPLGEIPAQTWADKGLAKASCRAGGNFVGRLSIGFPGLCWGQEGEGLDAKLLSQQALRGGGLSSCEEHHHTTNRAENQPEETRYPGVLGKHSFLGLSSLASSLSLSTATF